MNLIVNHVRQSLHSYDDMEAIRDVFSSVAGIRIAIANWVEYSYVPVVTCKMLHTNNSILLCYQVEEERIAATYSEINEPVYKDSCVEFFISFDGNSYYNFEFNCIGTVLVGYGRADKSTRTLLYPERIKLIDTDSKLHITKTGATWNLVVKIPIDIFYTHDIRSFKGLKCTGNFYKCGDDLPIPHFVSWTPIHHPQPNFHLPQFFGDLLFE